MLEKLLRMPAAEKEKTRKQMVRSAKRKAIYESLPDHHLAWLAKKAIWPRLKIFHVHSDILFEMISRLENTEIKKREAASLASKRRGDPCDRPGQTQDLPIRDGGERNEKTEGAA